MPSVTDHSESTQPASSTTELPDAEFLPLLEWRASAPARLKKAAQQGDVLAFAAAWKRQLRVDSPAKRLSLLQSVWPGEDDNSTSVGSSLARCLFENDLSNDELSGRVETILAGGTSSPPRYDELLAACWLLRMAGHRLQAETLMSFWRWTWEAGQAFIADAVTADSEEDCERFDQLEIAWLLSQSNRQLKGMGRLSRNAAAGWNESLLAALDGQGMPAADCLDSYWERIRQFARVSLAATCDAPTLWTGKGRKGLRSWLEHGAAMVGPGNVAFSALSPAQARRLLLTAASLLDVTLPEFLRHIGTGKTKRGKAEPRARFVELKGKRHHPSLQSDDSQWARLRSDWKTPFDQCLVRYDKPVPDISLIAAGMPLLEGAWSHELTCDGTAVAASDWGCSCWFCDRDAVYLELEQKPDTKTHLVRQALLLRREQLLLLADSVRLSQPAEIHLSRQLEIPGDWEFVEDAATREAALFRDGRRVRVVPLTAPQDKVRRSPESLACSSGQLIASKTVQGARTFLATVLDWNPDRTDDPVEFHPLTVAENSEVCTSDEAVGYGLRIGSRYWMVYHSLVAPTFPRTVFGLHTLSETVVAKLTRQGTLQPLLEVEV